MSAEAIHSIRQNRIALSVFFFIAGIRFASWASRIPDIQNHLHLSDAGLGSVLLALPLGSISGLPLSGYLVTKFGSRNILLLASLSFPVAMIFIGLAANVWQLALVLYFFGMTGNIMNISMNTQAVGLEVLYGKSIIASFHGLWSLAGFTGAAFGTWMIAIHISPFYHFLIICVLSLIMTMFFFTYTLQHDHGKTNSDKIFVKPDQAIFILGLIAFSSMVCEGTMFDWSGVYFHKVIKVRESLTTMGYVAFMSTMAGGRFIGDFMITRFGAKKILQISGMIISSGLMIAVIFPTIITATFGFLMVGVGVSSVVPLSYGLAGKSKKLSPSVAIASVSSIGFLGFLIGPPTIGFIAQAFNLRWSFALIACLGLGTTIVSRKLKV